jgi:alpha-glucosidase
VAVQSSEPTSMLNLYQALTALRRSEPALSIGGYAGIEVDNNDIFAFTRFFQGSDGFLVVLNFQDRFHELDLSSVAEAGFIEISTTMQRGGVVDLGSLRLAANEGLVIRLG